MSADRLLIPACLAVVTLIGVSDSVAGFCARAAVVVPLYWAGQFSGHEFISAASTQAAVLWHLF